MSDLFTHALTVFLGFFAIMNPIANTAVFVGLTGNVEPLAQKRIAFKALLISFFIVVTFAISGKIIFHLFAISLPALKLTGGVLVFIIGYQMLHGASSAMHRPQEHNNTDIAISPLAVPLLAGPGTIATAMNYSASGGWMEIIVTISTFAILSMFTYICFIFGQKMVSLVGNAGITIVTRLMGLILAVIGAQMLIDGTFSAINTFKIG